MAKGQMSRRGKSEEQKLQDKLDNLQSEYDKAKKLIDKEGDGITSRTKGAGQLLSQIDEVKQQLKDLKKAKGDGSTRAPKRPLELPDYGMVKPAPGSTLEDKGPARSKPPVPEKRQSTVDTQSKKPIAKRLMEALGDKRTMEQATKDREMNKRMEKETMGRKKGGMGQKKKAPVKKAYGGMVKKKQGGSANKVNMKAGFTRRGCSKG